MYKQLSWFDNKERAPGILSNVLSEDINSLNGMTTESFSLILEGIGSLLIGVFISFFLSWRVALVTLAAVPFTLFGGMIMYRLNWKNKAGIKDN